ALHRPKDKESVAAFQLGLRSETTRAVCEDELEMIGKLELPLPDDAYLETGYDQYQKMKSDKWFSLMQEVTKGSTIYFEALERIDPAIPRKHHWYRTKIVKNDK